MIGGPMDGPHALALHERLLELFADAGLDAAEAARASYLLIVYVFGSMALEVADAATAGPLPPESARVAVRRKAFAATPASQFPHTTAAAEGIASYISTDQYIWGLHRLLDGLTGSTAEDHDAGR